MQNRSRETVETGATSVEYAVLAALIAGILIAAVIIFGSAVTDLFVADWPF